MMVMMFLLTTGLKIQLPPNSNFSLTALWNALLFPKNKNHKKLADIHMTSDESGTRKPDPTRGFFTNPNPTRTRKKYYKPDPTRTRNIANPTRKPEKTRIYKKYVFLSKYT